MHTHTTYKPHAEIASVMAMAQTCDHTAAAAAALTLTSLPPSLEAHKPRTLEKSKSFKINKSQVNRKSIYQRLEMDAGISENVRQGQRLTFVPDACLHHQWQHHC